MTTGAFQRADARFRGWVDDFAPGRFHLYVARACPWSHRAMIVRHLKGLEDAVGISYAHPYRDERGWAFPGDGFTDALHGWPLLLEAYERSRPGYDDRVSVPVLWDEQEGVIVSNESSDIVRMFAAAGDEGPDLEPDDLRGEIDAINERVYRDVNNGVYRWASHARRRPTTRRSPRSSNGWPSSRRCSASAGTSPATA